MTKKKESFTVEADLSDLFAAGSPSNPAAVEESARVQYRSDSVSISIYKALDIVTRQMVQEGRRERTISDYYRYVKSYAKTAKISDLSDVTPDSIYLWLSSMKVANSTKLIRLKCLRAFLERCHVNAWLTHPFWRKINVKVSTPVKKGTEERDVMFVLSMLDLSDFVQLRDATAILTLFQTGIRVETAAKLKERHVDLEAKCLRIDGSIVKNHEAIMLPFDDRLAKLFEVLLEQNEKVRRDKRVKNDYVFITQHGDHCLRTPTNNNISKRINKYRKEFGLKHFSPHALRRGFANRLYSRSNKDIVLVSKALGHSDLAVTTRYLQIETEEVAEGIRKYL